MDKAERERLIRMAQENAEARKAGKLVPYPNLREDELQHPLANRHMLVRRFEDFFEGQPPSTPLASAAPAETFPVAEAPAGPELTAQPPQRVYWHGPTGDVPYPYPPTATAETVPQDAQPRQRVYWHGPTGDVPYPYPPYDASPTPVASQTPVVTTHPPAAAPEAIPQAISPQPNAKAPASLGSLIGLELPGMEPLSPPKDKADFQQRKQGWMEVLHRLANDPELQLLMFRVGTGLMRGESLGAALQGSADFHFARKAAEAKQRDLERARALEERKAQALIEQTEANTAKIKSETLTPEERKEERELAKRKINALIKRYEREGKVQPTQLDALVQLYKQAYPEMSEQEIAKAVIQATKKAGVTTPPSALEIAIERVRSGVGENITQEVEKINKDRYTLVPGTFPNGTKLYRDNWTGQYVER